MNIRYLPSGFDMKKINIDELDRETILEDEIYHTYFYGIDDPLERAKYLEEIREKARELSNVRAFENLFKAHSKEFKRNLKGIDNGNVIDYMDPPIKGLYCGKWTCGDDGVSYTRIENMEPVKTVACTHPIMPTARLINIDDATEKISISFYKDNRWNEIIVPRSQIASNRKIVELSDRGIEVNSNNASDLVSFLADCIAINIDSIPVHKSIDHMGFTKNRKSFVPYAKGIRYDGDTEYLDTYEAIKSKGNYDKWKEEISRLKDDKLVHLLIATSFASPLIELTETLPFIVHLWGESGTGKTVAMLVAMSVWGDPRRGKLVKTMNTTAVGIGRLAGFLNNIPFAGDELQIIKDRWNNNFDNLIMLLTEGIDRIRGTAQGGVEKLNTWNCNFIFTGEEPITNSFSGGGVKNRVIEVEVSRKLIEDGHSTAVFFSEHHGHAGEEYIKKLPDKDELIKRYREIQKNILDSTETTEKQAMAMGLIMLGDELSEELIFGDGKKLELKDVQGFLNLNKEVDVSERAYEYIVNWIDSNQKRFTDLDNPGEIWGRLDFDNDECLINRSVLDKELRKNGYSYRAIMPKWSDKGYIERDTRDKFVHSTHAYGIKGTYIRLNLPKVDGIEDISIEIEPEDLPF